LLVAGADPSNAEVRRHKYERLGRRRSGGAFLPDLYPLPSPGRKFMEWYGPTGLWRTYDEYCEEVGPSRARALMDLARRRKTVRWIFVYDQSAVPLLLAAWHGTLERKRSHRLPAGVRWYRLHGIGERVVNLVGTPFWGQGRFTKAALAELAGFVRRDLCHTRPR
jgi:hypothetical protein